MTVFECIRGLRAVRRFADRPLPKDTVRRILEAGRRGGSAKNRQPWHFIVVPDPGMRDRLAACGQYASHLRGAPLVVVLVTATARFADLDAGRCAQNMLLAISFGYPPAEPDTAIEGLRKAQVLASLGRRPVSDLVHAERW